MNLQERHTVSHVEEWRREGFTLIPEFFSTEEILPIIEDFQELYEDRGQGEGVGTPLNKKEEGAIGAGHPKQFMNIDSLPYNASSAINLISLHPALINFAKSLLDVDDVHLYQSHTWAKYTGEADYDQAFHCDFGNHTLTVPADDVSLRTVDFILYLTDVTDAHGALHYVTKTDSDRILGSGAVFAKDDQQFALKEKERSAAAPAGSLLAHSIDTFHRGTNLTEIDGHRFTMTVGYKASGNEMIGFHVWQSAADRPWPIVLNNATPEQLQCLGIPMPGDVFWTDRTLKLTQLRWPEWDMSVYAQAMKSGFEVK
tara:strand:- start:129 stop:1067 length:939 start_codon:yes stop_codon:yes gene_type:complete